MPDYIMNGQLLRLADGQNPLLPEGITPRPCDFYDAYMEAQDTGRPEYQIGDVVDGRVNTVMHNPLTPAEAPGAYLDEAPATAAWEPDGMSCFAGEAYTYEGDTWVCVQSHKSQIDWPPPAVPALFNKIATSSEWDYPVAYSVGDEVTYLGSAYRCLQAHTSQLGWEPPAVPALWEIIQ